MTAREPGPASFPRPFGKYTLLSHLAIGGMADVFLAQHKGPAGFEKECVIKRILPHLAVDQEFVQMFLDEARIAARLSHPNIVQIFDLGQLGGDYFLAMEFVDGINLEHIMDEARGPQIAQRVLPWPIAVRIVADVAAGLDHAHNVRDSAGRPLLLVHRDVSPSNVMVSWGGAAKILDFGIAKAMVSSVKKSRTEVGTIKGKIPYMSPEQLQGFPLDGRSDVFSLGVILYEATCGARPFPAETAAQLTMQILHDDPKPPEVLIDGYPQGLKPVLLRALAKQPEQRWQTAREFQLALEQCLKDHHAACTAYDVEAYLREVFPEARRPRRAMASASDVGADMAPDIAIDQTEVSQVGRVATPYQSGADHRMGAQAGGVERAPRGMKKPAERERSRMERDENRDDLKLGSVTGLHQGPGGSMADLANSAGGLDEMDDDSRRPRRGGGGIVTVVILLLVAGTAVGFYLLRGYELQKEKLGDSRVTDGAKPSPPPQPATSTQPTSPTQPASTPAQVKPVVTAHPGETPAPVKAPTAIDPPKVKVPERDRPRRVVHPTPPVHKPPQDEPVRLPRLPTPPPPDPE